MVRLNVPMMRRLARRIHAGRPFDMMSLAQESVAHCAPRLTCLPAAIYVDAAIDRVSGVSPFRKLENEKALCAGGRMELGASVSHVIRDVDIAGAFLYAKAGSRKVGFGSQSPFLRGADEWQWISKASLSTTSSGSHFFGCMLLDDFPLELLAEENDNISMTAKSYEHEAGYRELLHLGKPPCVRNARVGKLTIHDDASFNSHKTARFRELRDRIKRTHSSAARLEHPGVYIRRGTGGERRTMENEAQVEGLLQAAGFDILDPSALSAAELVRRSFGARIVVGIEGSHLSHAIFSMHDDAAFLVLQPPDRFALNYKEFSDAFDMRYAFVVGTKSSRGFSVCMNEFQRTLDLLI